MSSLTYHRKPNGVTYVYHQESYWDKEKKQSSSRQVCVGKLDESGQIIYNQRFKTPEAREALERGETVAESINIGQSLILAKATRDTGLERVLYRSFESKEVDVLLSLAWAVATGLGPMNLAGVWLEQNDCPVHKDPPSPFDIARILASVSQSQIENFLGEWTKHRKKGQKQQYCYDLPLMSSPDMSNPFDDWDDNCDGEDLAQINMILLTGVNSQIPTYYEIAHGSMLEARSDTKTIASFVRRMKKYGLERIRLLLDSDFYSEMNISRLLEARIRFYIPVPTTVDWLGQFIDLYRDEVEMPDQVISFSEDESQALYGLTVPDNIDGHRVWKHLYFDGPSRIAHINSLFAALRRWEGE
ncbi:MAG: hypothetical protein LBS44_04075, partial [Deltaproteobacteria bacterium]|nr:hypothetical protein [Deltaproteobacteria bacterium]